MLKRNYQILFSLVLIIFIPLALIAYTYLTIQGMKETMDIELQRKALIIENILNITFKESLDSPSLLQQKLLQIVKDNPDIKTLRVFIPKGDKFKIIAALSSKEIGQEVQEVEYNLSWSQNQVIAYLMTPSLMTRNDKQDPAALNKEERFWRVVAPLKDKEDKKTALMALSLSSKIIDDLVYQTIIRSYFILVILILIILLLIVSQAKLFQYAVRFIKLKEIDQMKDDFIAMASHELRAPLTAISGYLNLIIDKIKDKLDSEDKKDFTKIMVSTQRLNDLVDDILDVSQLTQGRLKISLEPLDIAPYLKNIVQGFQGQAQQKGLHLEFIEPQTDVPSIMADPVRLKQVLVNLINNALKYTQKGSVVLSVVSEKKYLSIKIKDTGIGMAAIDRENLFKKFYRIRNIKTTEITGTGLGLYITKSLVELMKGKIYIDSLEGVGTEVRLLLPI